MYFISGEYVGKRCPKSNIRGRLLQQALFFHNENLWLRGAFRVAGWKILRLRFDFDCQVYSVIRKRWLSVRRVPLFLTYDVNCKYRYVFAEVGGKAFFARETAVWNGVSRRVFGFGLPGLSLCGAKIIIFRKKRKKAPETGVAHMDYQSKNTVH